MRLIKRKTGRPIVEFKGGDTVIHNKFLEREMRSIGIPIPHGLRGLFHGRDCVYLDDDDFQKAFKEVYFLTAMDAEEFTWEQ